MSPRLRLLALICLVALAVVALVASCGGGDDKARADLRAAFSGDHPVRSGRLELALRADLKGIAGIGQPIDLQLAGPFQSAGGTELPRFNLELTMGGQTPVSLGMISTGKSGFITIAGQPFDLGAEAYKQLKQGYAEAQRRDRSKRRSSVSLKALGVDPERWVTDPTRKGEENIGGTQTIRLAAGVDAEALLEDVQTLLSRSSQVGGSNARDLPSRMTDEQRDALARSIEKAAVDVWVGKGDKALRKLALHVELEVDEDDRDKLGGLRSGTVDFSMTLAQLNQRQSITAPEGALPLSALEELLAAGGLFGSAQGGADSGSSQRDRPTGKQADYVKCLEEAGDDVEKIQACASVLEK
jgi:hypothetical protein